MEKQKLFVQDKINAIHKTKTTSRIIKHTIIHINMYFGNRDERCFSSSPECNFYYFLQFLCIPFMYCLYSFFVIQKDGKY